MTAETECPKVILYLKSGLFSHQTTVSTDYYYVEMFDSYSNQTCGKLIMINALSTAPDNLLQTGAFLLIRQYEARRRSALMSTWLHFKPHFYNADHIVNCLLGTMFDL